MPLFWSDDFDRAALNVVCDNLHVGSVWPGNSEHKIEAMQETINKARAWISAVPDWRARWAYTKWVDFYEGRVCEARRNLTTHAYEKRIAKYDVEFRERWRRADEITKTMPKPTSR